MAYAGSYKGIDHKVPARNEARVLVEIDVEPQNGTVVCGQHVKHGKHKIIVYRSQLDELTSRVRTPEHEAALKAAHRAFDTKLDEHLRPSFGRTWRAAQDEDTKRAIQQAIARFGETSVWAEFSRFYREGMPPLKSAEVLEDVPAPDTAEARADRSESNMERMLAALVEAVAGKQAKAQAR